MVYGGVIGWSGGSHLGWLQRKCLSSEGCGIWEANSLGEVLS